MNGKERSSAGRRPTWSRPTNRSRDRQTIRHRLLGDHRSQSRRRSFHPRSGTPDRPPHPMDPSGRADLRRDRHQHRGDAPLRLFVQPSTDRHDLPIGIGDQGKETPVGTFTIIEKIIKPAWYVPESIRKEEPDLPAVVPPGPDNPMGSHALRLSNPTLLIHGTNRPWGIGMRSSHGCIRLYQEDISVLFGMVKRGTPVTIVDQPVKAAAGGSCLPAGSRRVGWEGSVRRSAEGAGSEKPGQPGRSR